jgi:hypothetical protein
MAIVYLAGKIFIGEQDWRYQLFAPDVPCQESNGSWWLQEGGILVTTRAPRVSTNGPFCAGFHTIDSGEKYHRRVHDLCTSALRACDFVFANLSDPSCHGTLWELGYAKALGKKVAVWSPDCELWFATAGADAVCTKHPLQIIDAALRKQESIQSGSIIGAFMAVCALWAPAPCPGDSPIEKAFAAAWLVIAGAYPKAQVPIGSYRVDFVVGGNLVVECDGHDYHSTKEQRASDAKRDRELMAAGFRVIRFTGSEIHADAAACARQAFELADLRT